MSNQSITVTDHTTKFTHLHEKVVVENDKVYLKSYHYKQLLKPSQFKYIIEDLVINHGFVMDKQTGNMLTLTNPLSNQVYTLWTQTLEVERCDTVFKCNLF